jgi:hypothetical protein
MLPACCPDLVTMLSYAMLQMLGYENVPNTTRGALSRLHGYDWAPPAYNVVRAGHAPRRRRSVCLGNVTDAVLEESLELQATFEEFVDILTAYRCDQRAGG